MHLVLLLSGIQMGSSEPIGNNLKMLGMVLGSKGPFKWFQHLLQHVFNTVVEPNVGGVRTGRSTLLKAEKVLKAC